jgi:hypothetical protein
MHTAGVGRAPVHVHHYVGLLRPWCLDNSWQAFYKGTWEIRLAGLPNTKNLKKVFDPSTYFMSLVL